jgi:hypothetical protein
LAKNSEIKSTYILKKSNQKEIWHIIKFLQQISLLVKISKIIINKDILTEPIEFLEQIQRI